MPRRLLLLILVLLVGGYFFFLGGGASQKEELPSLSLRPVVNPSQGGYIVGAEGRLELPMEVEYNVSGEVWIKSGGVKVKREAVDAVVKGPSNVPLNIAGEVVSSEDVSVGADLRVISNGKEYSLSVELPLLFPPKSSSFQPLGISVSPSSIVPVEGGYEVTLSVLVSNPNDFEVDIENALLNIDGERYTLALSSVPPQDSSSTEVTFVVDTNKIEGKVTLEGVWSGVRKRSSASFVMSLPSVDPPMPYFSLSLSSPSVTSDGIKVSVALDINNPSFAIWDFDSIKLVVKKGDVVKELLLGENIVLDPYGSKRLEGSLDAIPFFSGGEVYVEVKRGDETFVPVRAPFELFSLVIEPPKVYLWADEVNTGAYVVNVKLENPNGFPVLIKDFRLEAYYSGAKIFEYNTADFLLEDVWSYSEGDANSPVSLARGSELNVHFLYGLELYNLFYEYAASTYVDKPS